LLQESQQINFPELLGTSSLDRDLRLSVHACCWEQEINSDAAFSLRFREAAKAVAHAQIFASQATLKFFINSVADYKGLIATMTAQEDIMGERVRQNFSHP
jgi:hypothetical protein